MRFGKLVPFEIDEEKMKNRKSYDTHAYWKCKCDCGNICTVSSSCLIQGHTKSCGCESSHGEIIIANVLNQSEWSYKREYTFPDLTGDEALLRFDFAVFKEDQLLFMIEFQGKQHYEAVKFFGGEERLYKQQEYDKKKYEYCKNNHIPLIVIPYYEQGKITLEYIKEKFYETKEIFGH